MLNPFLGSELIWKRTILLLSTVNNYEIFFLFLYFIQFCFVLLSMLVAFVLVLVLFMPKIYMPFVVAWDPIFGFFLYNSDMHQLNQWTHQSPETKDLEWPEMVFAVKIKCLRLVFFSLVQSFSITTEFIATSKLHRIASFRSKNWMK